jgi:hypothetical protein
MEHHYREAVPDEEWRACADKVRRCLQGFHGGMLHTTLQQLPRDRWLSIERLETFEISHVKVFVKMDVAYRGEDGGAVIVDWKTGRRTPQPGGLQLGCYALYASGAWGLEPGEIRVVEANLFTGEVASARIAADHLAAARDAIAAGITEMRARLADPENNVAKEQDLPAAPQARRCGRCAFREVCTDCREVLTAEACAARGEGIRA